MIVRAVPEKNTRNVAVPDIVILSTYLRLEGRPDGSMSAVRH